MALNVDKQPQEHDPVGSAINALLAPHKQTDKTSPSAESLMSLVPPAVDLSWAGFVPLGPNGANMGSGPPRSPGINGTEMAQDENVHVLKVSRIRVTLSLEYPLTDRINRRLRWS